MISRSDLLACLEELYQTSVIPDVSYNGLQFEGKKEIRRIVTGVDASPLFLERAVQAGADFAIVHHGIFWKGGEWCRIDRFARRRVEILSSGDLNLYALHLPLDAHPEIGNNVLIATALGMVDLTPFSSFRQQKIGFLGRLPQPMTPQQLHNQIEKVIGPVSRHLPFGPDTICTVGVVSGSGWDAVSEPQVADGEVDAILTGEMLHQGFQHYQERAVHLFAAGHYATEIFGVRALGEHLKNKFQLEHTFIDLPTGL